MTSQTAGKSEHLFEPEKLPQTTDNLLNMSFLCHDPLKRKKKKENKLQGLTGNPCHASLQPRAPGADLVRPAFAHRPHGELELAPGDVLAPVLDVDRVRAHLLGDEAHAVRAAPPSMMSASMVTWAVMAA